MAFSMPPVYPSGYASTPLSPEQMEEDLLAEELYKKSSGLVVNVGKTWLKALESEFSNPDFLKLAKFVQGERINNPIYPPADQVFSWTQFSDIDQVKVVILGQDPYYKPNQAHGLCFSVPKDVPPPPSLVKIYRVLGKDIEGFRYPGHGTLYGWARQGVLLLNACLTVRANKPNSHAGKGWERFTDAVISWLNKNGKGIVFMLWGAAAIRKEAFIDEERHCILKTAHPSSRSLGGFSDCKHFSKCNTYLLQQEKKSRTRQPLTGGISPGSREEPRPIPADPLISLCF